ncbi:unnamed protein product [Timema podura]|uniref:G kinase-anchoring protein 1 n=1 Tax=Timema podura TaxID=61482 RepID=A0ABN7NSV0_TIMPD|nr:unnamed protein product [Timema podura]
MASMVASRFAVLSVDDDDDAPKKNQKKRVDSGGKKTGISNQKTDPMQKKKSKKPEPGKALDRFPSPVAKEASPTTSPLLRSHIRVPEATNTAPNQTLTKYKAKSSGKGDGNGQKKKPAATAEQWDQWKKKDSEFVDGNYEEDLQQAILLSKLDFEEKKDVYQQLKKDADDDKKSGNKKAKKSNKPQTMSLDEFNNMNATSSGVGENDVELASPVDDPDPEFFQRIKDDAKKAIDREQSLEKRKAREPFIQEAITKAQLEDSVERKDKEIIALKEDVVKLKEELHQCGTKQRYLLKWTDCRRVKDELSSEVSSLYAQLEQERSKVRALSASDPKNKSQVGLNPSRKQVRYRRETEDWSGPKLTRSGQLASNLVGWECVC